ncbi:hypothetical protein ACVXG8_20080 [Escherichia coli]
MVRQLAAISAPGGSPIVYTGGIAHGVNQETGSALVANTAQGLISKDTTSSLTSLLPEGG